MKICFASSEIVPFAKTGGLADVSGALGKYLGASHDVRLFMPLYNTVDLKQNYQAIGFIHNVPVDMGGRELRFTAVSAKLPGSNVDVYLIDCPHLYYRGSLYTQDQDEYMRFAFFSRAVIECCQRMGWTPHVFHCNDWQTALIPLYLKTVYRWDSMFQDSKSILTIHNIGYQGTFSADCAGEIGLGNYYEMLPQEDLVTGSFSYLKTGIIYADAITAVSESYAREIQSPEYGAGLDVLLRMRDSNLFGIVNGVDYNEWSPEYDRYIPYRYSIRNLAGKEINKRALLERLSLPYNPDAPVFGIVSRLTPQKGFELLEPILLPILENSDVRFLILGGGEYKYEELFSAAQRYFPNKVCFYRGFSNELAHLIEAGSDMFVMPSRYEPCGLNQIYSLKYGTVPVVRKTGGLADTVIPWNSETAEGTGFVFEHFTPKGLTWAIEKALETFQNKNAWQRLMLNGMSQNYSWEKQVKKYIALYQMLERGRCTSIQKNE